MTLDLREIRGHGSVVRNLISVGVVVTWATITLAAHLLMALQYAAQAVAVPLLIGFLLGRMASIVTERALLKHWMPHYLRNPAMLCFMLGVYALVEPAPARIRPANDDRHGDDSGQSSPP